LAAASWIQYCHRVHEGVERAALLRSKSMVNEGESFQPAKNVGVARQMLHEQHAIVAGKAYGRSYWLARMATAVRH
jgi:hypothetical protein